MTQPEHETLEEAAEKGDLDTVKMLLKTTGDLESYNRTLNLAVEKGYTAVVKILLESPFSYFLSYREMLNTAIKKKV